MRADGAGRRDEGDDMGEQKQRAQINADTRGRISLYLKGIGIEPGADPVDTLIAHQKTLDGHIRELADYRACHEAPGWTYAGDYSAGGHLSDAEVAGKVRMLMRNDLDHESVCVMARDRIRDLSRYVDALKGALQAAGAAVPEMARGK
jgi:hypothetical protein